jgi:hypothetical protein
LKQALTLKVVKPRPPESWRSRSLARRKPRESEKAHAGALFGLIEAFDALREDLGVIQAHSLE